MAAQPGSVLSVDAITKKFGSIVALDDLSWSVEPAQTKAVIGPNGAGKTTFFNIITGILQPTSGSVSFRSEDITGLEPYKIVQQGIVKTFQVTNLFEEITVYENIRAASQARVSTFSIVKQVEEMPEITETAKAVLERIGMQDQRDTTVTSLSHGDKRKVEIGLALATKPAIIIFDEPTAGMSAEETEAILDLLEVLKQDESLTLVITEHNVDFILELADEVSVLHQGTVIAEGPPDAITADERVQEVYLGEA
jgi:branched-chain amino acid transport system ATP-binding protein